MGSVHMGKQEGDGNGHGHGDGDATVVTVIPPSSTATFNISVRNLSYTRRQPGILPRLLSTIAETQKSLARPTALSVHNNQAYEGEPEAAGQHILRNVTFHASPGEITAIAGPSGAGKTTLLGLMAGEIGPCRAVRVNDEVLGSAMLRRVCGFVTQDDAAALLPSLTVREMLMYSARLRLPGAMAWGEKVEKVERVIRELGLGAVVNSVIGSPGDGISGGERRRTSVGVHSIHDPAILFLDEPTSGLDSAAAMQLVAALQKSASASSRTVVLSIHQPSILILRLVSSIVLIAGGEVVHRGSLDELSSRLRGAGHCVPPEMTALDFAIHHCCVLPPEETKTQTLRETTQTETEHFLLPEFDYNNKWAMEIWILATRFYRTTFHPASRTLLQFSMLQNFLTSLSLGTLFFRTGSHLDERGIQQRNGLLAYCLMFLLTSAGNRGLPIFLQERIVVTREVSRGTYRKSSYVSSTCFVFMVCLFPEAVAFAVPVYFMAGLCFAVGNFFFFLMVVWMSLITGNSVVALVSALGPDHVRGNCVTQGLLGAFFLFSGYFIAKHDIPGFMVFVSYLSLFKYPLEALLINEFSGLSDKCFLRRHLPEEQVPLDNIDMLQCQLTGEGVLREAGLSEQSKWMSVVVMAAYVVAYRVLSYIVLRVTI